MAAIRRSGARISAETAAELRGIIAKHDQIRSHLDKATAICQQLLAENDQAEMEAKMERQ